MLEREGLNNFCLEIAGDIQTKGKNSSGEKWQIGIQNPFDLNQIVKVVNLSGYAIATSGNYQKGKHIYNPKKDFKEVDEVASVSVVASNIYDADIYATAIFAMGMNGVHFAENNKEVAVYLIDKNGIAFMTSNFSNYVN